MYKKIWQKAKNIFDNVVIPHDRQVKELKYSNDDGK